MLNILIGVAVLGFIHALIPSHWLPLAALSRHHRWNTFTTMKNAFLMAFAHISSTILLGFLLGYMGLKMSDEISWFSSIIIPLVLVIMGLIYFTLSEAHHHHPNLINPKRDKWFLPLFVMMFLSPCLEVEPIFIAAGGYGLNTLLITGLVYAAITIGSMLVLTYLAINGFKLLPLHRLEHNEKKLTGFVLILVGILSFFIN